MTLIEPSWDKAREAAADLAKLVRLSATEKVAINQSNNRVLAIDAKSLVDLPTYITSAMDGYVVAGNGPWDLIGEIKAGAPFQGKLQPGQALGIATGAVIPEGAFGILRWENATVNGNQIIGETSEEKDFRPAGEEAKLNEVLVEKGTTLTPAMVGLLAAAGFDEIEVAKRPTVGLLLLGDEIQLSGLPKNGFVRDSLGPQIPIWLEKLGCEVLQVEYISDKLDLTISAIEEASKKFDILVTTGGTAGGPRDFLHTAIAKLNGVIHVDKVAVRPGHPQLLATVNGKPLIGLPGNPQSAVVALLTLGAPLINTILGKPNLPLPVISSDDLFDAQPGFTRLVLGTLDKGHFKIGKYLGSAMLRSLAHSDGFAVCTNPPTTLRWLGLPL
jgi:molybdopterin molybdotransferase